MKFAVDSRRRDAFLEDGVTPGTVENYIYQIFGPVPAFKCLRLVNAVVPNTFYTVISGYNSRFEFQYAGTFAADVAEGTYTPAEYAVALAAAMNTAATAGGDITVTYSASTNKFTFGVTAVNLTIMDNGLNGGFAGTAPQPAVRRLIGRGIAGTSTITAPGTLEMDSMADFNGPMKLYLTVFSGASSLSTGVWDTQGQHDFQVEMVNSEFLDYAYMNEQSDYRQGVKNDRQQVIRLRITWDTDIPILEGTDSLGAVTSFPYPLDFQNIDHWLLFAIVE